MCTCLPSLGSICQVSDAGHSDARRGGARPSGAGSAMPGSAMPGSAMPSMYILFNACANAFPRFGPAWLARLWFVPVHGKCGIVERGRIGGVVIPGVRFDCTGLRGVC